MFFTSTIRLPLCMRRMLVYIISSTDLVYVILAVSQCCFSKKWVQQVLGVLSLRDVKYLFLLLRDILLLFDCILSEIILLPCSFSKVKCMIENLKFLQVKQKCALACTHYVIDFKISHGRVKYSCSCPINQKLCGLLCTKKACCIFLSSGSHQCNRNFPRIFVY